MSDTPAVKTKSAGFKISPEQYRQLEQRAAHCGIRVSTWIRLILLQAASQKPRKGYLHIREPDGTML